MKRAAALAALAVTITGLTLAGAHADQAGSLTVPVDRQAYVTSSTATNPTDGSTVDAYDGDPSSIHVAVNGGQDFARSFVHLALDYLPSGATATEATMTLHVTEQSDASSSGTYPIYNVNASAAIVQACALTTELKANFDPKSPPAYDCEHGSAIGKPNSAGDTWTFALKDLLPYWQQHGNTGAALIPVGSGQSGQSWSVAFYKSRSSSVITYTATAAAPGANSPTGPVQAAPAVPASGPPAGGAPAAPLVTSSPQPPSAVPSAPATASPSASPGPASPGVPAGNTAGPQIVVVRHTTGSPVWPWVLVACIAVGMAAIGAANRAAVLGAIRGHRALDVFRAHPRAYTLAMASIVWGLVFSGYSVAVHPSTTRSTTLAAGATSRATGGAGRASVSAPGAASPGTNSADAQQATAAGGIVASEPGAGGASSSVQPGASNPAATEFSGTGTYKTIDGIPVFFPSDGSPPVAKLFSGADDTVGLSPSEIRLCAHAALTYGAAFHISANDLDVWWHKVNDQGGIFGRKVTTNYQNDNYDPGTAVQAAQTCKDWNTFVLLGGIGFDQIPAVRQWAEQNHELYLHHIATVEGDTGLRYSFSSLPSVEQVGTWMGQLAVQQFRGQKIGILYRQSSNWEPGVTAFTSVAKAAGMQIVGSYGVTINQGNYTQELTQLHTAGAQVVFAWENALSEIEMIKQAQGQNWHPAWLVNGFNIITNTLGSTALDQQMWSAAEWEAYDPGYYGGGFAAYAPDIHEFEAEYKKYDPGADLTGDGGDLLFLNWESQRGLYDLLQACGPGCTRNKVAGLLLAGWNKTSSPACNVNFGGVDGDHHHGGYLVSVLHAVKDPNGRANFVPTQRCVPNL